MACAEGQASTVVETTSASAMCPTEQLGLSSLGLLSATRCRWDRENWAERYRAEGPAGMVDRSSRPHRQPHRTPVPVVRKVVHLRWKQRLGPVEIGDRLGMPSSTVHAVLFRFRINRLIHIDRVTGELIRRYEHGRPGDLIHVDVKKLGNVPDGGGRRYVGRQYEAPATGLSTRPGPVSQRVSISGAGLSRAVET
jgi:hypothetical protein